MTCNAYSKSAYLIWPTEHFAIYWIGDCESSLLYGPGKLCILQLCYFINHYFSKKCLVYWTIFIQTTHKHNCFVCIACDLCWLIHHRDAYVILLSDLFAQISTHCVNVCSCFVLFNKWSKELKVESGFHSTYQILSRWNTWKHLGQVDIEITVSGRVLAWNCGF